MTVALDRAMMAAIEALAKWPSRNVRLFHHNDADGLSSGTIMLRALTRAGYTVYRCCLEKPYPPVLEKIFQQQGDVIIFADFAGRIAQRLANHNRGRNLVLILDHHPAVPSEDPWIHNIDPDLYGFRGDRDVSASTVCFRFAVRLDRANRDLAYLAVVGAVGDGFYEEGRLAALNRLAAETAVEMDQLDIRMFPDGEDYLLPATVFDCAVHQVASDLDVLGGVGFFQGGPEVGIRLCVEGYGNAVVQLREELNQHRHQIYAAEIKRLRQGALSITPGVQWFSVQERFDGMGVKMVGDFCRFIREEPFIDPQKYIAGFQPVPNFIPGLGKIDFQAVKVSMRVPCELEKRILSGEAPGLDRLLPEATRRVGGFADACHSLAAATTVPPGKEAQLVGELDKLLEE